MIRTLAAAVAFATLTLAAFAPAGSASAQTWGQPVYLDAWGRPIGNTPLSEVETRAYLATGFRADGYSDRPHVYVPTPGYGHSGRGYRGDYRDHGRRYDSPARSGYRDEWGYNDDRPPSAQRWSDDGRSRRRDRDCNCADVYLYDR